MIDYITTPQITAKYGVSVHTVYRAIQSKELPTLNGPKPGKTKFFPQFDPTIVDAWVKERAALKELRQAKKVKKVKKSEPLSTIVEFETRADWLAVIDVLHKIDAKLSKLITLWGG